MPMGDVVDHGAIPATKKAKRTTHPSLSTTPSTLSFARPHPLNIKPAGNALVASSPPTRHLTLGTWASLSDELITHIITAYPHILTPNDICTLSALSSAWRAFANQESVWRGIFIEACSGTIRPEIGWRGSWKMTSLAHLADRKEGITAFASSSRLAQVRPRDAFYSDSLYLPHRLSLLPLARYLPTETPDGNNPSTPIPRIPALSSLEDFHTHYAAQNRPVIIEAAAEAADAAGMGLGIDDLKQRYPSRWIRAEAIRTSVAVYADYARCCERQQENLSIQKEGQDEEEEKTVPWYDPMTVPDESPFYLFDSDIPSQMAKDGLWTLPRQIASCPSEPYKIDRTEKLSPLSSSGRQRREVEADLFSLLTSSRPDYRWLIAGPTRSGSGWHKDPNYTSAWNTPLSGRKLWLMLPPHVTPPGVYVSEDGAEVTAPVSLLEWLDDFYLETKRRHGPSPRGGDGLLLEGICSAGETVYVPSGWWHLVLNLQPSVALTQNLVSLAELPQVLFFMKRTPDQISGFKFAKLSRGGEGKGEGGEEEEEGQDEDEDEDGFSGGGEEDPRRGLFDIFLSKLKAYDEDLSSWALEEVAKMEEREKCTLQAARCARQGVGNAAGGGGGDVIKRKRKVDQEDDDDDGGDGGGLTWWDRLKAGENGVHGDTREDVSSQKEAGFLMMDLEQEEMEEVPW